VHDAMGAVEICKAAENCFADFAEDVDPDGAKVLRNGVESAVRRR